MYYLQSEDVMMLYHRFYITLILHSLLNLTTPDSIWRVADKFHCSRGFLQSIMNSTASYTSCLVHFTAVSYHTMVAVYWHLLPLGIRTTYLIFYCRVFVGITRAVVPPSASTRHYQETYLLLSSGTDSTHGGVWYETGEYKWAYATTKNVCGVCTVLLINVMVTFSHATYPPPPSLSLSQGRARQLLSAGIITPQQLASSDPHQLVECMDNLFPKQAKRLIMAAKVTCSVLQFYRIWHQRMHGL